MAIATATLCLALFQQPAATPSAPAPLLDLHYGENEKQVLDLYLPAKKDFPTVVFTYGGGWHSGSGKSCTPIAEALRAHGYGCALLSHRLSPPDVWPAMIEDEARAFAWVHEHVAEHGGDPQRLFLMGHSSGAQLALLLASDARQLAPYHLAPKNVAGVVGLSTPLDLVPRGGTGYGDALMGGKGADVFRRDAETMRAASPLTYLSKELPPLLLVVGENDFPMLAGDAEDFAKRAGALGLDVGVVVAEGKDHMGVVRSLLDAHDPSAGAVFEFLDALAFPEAK
ncbi:MAG: alpha/beta hydrolase [Planctomycetes bacterium]|nr:alpha/beta hydrolase [Planctomycetota bacterium]